MDAALIRLPGPCADGEQTCAGFPWWVQALLAVVGCLIAVGLLNLLSRLVLPRVPHLDLSALERAHVTPAGEPDARALLTSPVQWRSTGNGEAPYVAELAGRSWTLRVNDFPAEPLYTLLCDGLALDLEDWPTPWVRPPLPFPPAPRQPAPGPGAG